MSVESMKRFFGTPEKPVTNAELIALAKADKPGYEELSKATEEALK